VHDRSAIDSSSATGGALMGRYAPRGLAFAAALLALGLALTLAGWKYADNGSNKLARERFEFRATEISRSINDRVTAYELVLRGGLALFSSVEDVGRSQWRDYVGKLSLQQSYPGIQGIGYAQVVPAASKQEHIETIRRQGFPDYTLRPPGERLVYTSIIYLEPFDARNQRAFGYDMFSEPTRRVAMERTRDTGKTTISGRVTLVQETTDGVQAGFLMYLPFYRPGAPVLTVEERRAALQGYVYSPFRMNDFMQGLLGKHISDLRLEVFDAAAMTEQTLMFRDGSEALDTALRAGRTPLFTSVRQIDIFGRTWTVRLQSLPAFEATIDHRAPRLVIVAGLCLSLLLFFIALSLVSTQARAVALASRMTSSLRESEEKIRLILESTGEPIYGIDTKGECTFYNAACLRVLGYSSPEDLLGRNMHDRIHHSHPDGSSFDVHDCRIFKAFQEGNGTHVDDEVLWRADGSSFPAEYWSYPQRSGGEIVGAVVVFQDITERRQAEAFRIEKAKEFHTLLDGLPGYAFQKDAEGRYVAANAAFADALNIPLAEIIGKTDYEIFPKDLAEKFCADDKRILTGELGTLETEEQMIDRGRTLTVFTRKLALKSLSGNVTGLIGLGFDITEKKKMEIELNEVYTEMEKRVINRTHDLIKANESLNKEVAARKQSIYELDTMFSAVSSILITLGPSGRVRMWNRAADNTFHLSKKEAKGKPFSLLPLEWEWGPIQEGIAKSKDQLKPVKINNIKFQRPDSGDGYLMVTISPLLSEDEHYEGGLILGEDITELKFLEAQLSQSQKLEAIGQLAAGIAHEINTPTQYISNSATFIGDAFADLQRVLDLIRAAGNDDVSVESLKLTLEEIDYDFLREEIPKSISRVEEGLERVSTIVQAMKRFSHPGRGEKEFVDMNQAVMNTLVVSRNEWKYVADVQTDYAPGLPPVLCFPGELNQVLLNVIVNAAHAISDLVQETQGKGLITITTKQDGDMVEISIADTGSGIPQAVQKKVFDPFFTTKEVGKGTGQGLAISYDIVVNKHGGAITFESTLGVGTTFYIRLHING